jgi:nitrogen fixation NifU-like protein
VTQAVSEATAALYQDVIIDHGRRPRNFGDLPDATRTVEGINPLCGDQLTLHLKFDDGVISAVAFEGSGCAISQASASLMTGALKGMRTSDALALFGRVHTMLTVQPDEQTPEPDVGKLAVLSGVWQYPARVKCATLAWQTLRSALDEQSNEME